MQQVNKKLLALLALLAPMSAINNDQSSDSEEHLDVLGAELEESTTKQSKIKKIASAVVAPFKGYYNASSFKGFAKISLTEQFSVMSKDVTVNADVTFDKLNSKRDFYKPDVSLAVAVANFRGGLVRTQRMTEVTNESEIANRVKGIRGSNALYVGGNIAQLGKATDITAAVFTTNDVSKSWTKGLGFVVSADICCAHAKAFFNDKALTIATRFAINKAFVEYAGVTASANSFSTVRLFFTVKFAKYVSVIVSTDVARKIGGAFYNWKATSSSVNAAVVLSYAGFSLYADKASKISLSYASPALNAQSFTKAFDRVTKIIRRA